MNAAIFRAAAFAVALALVAPAAAEVYRVKVRVGGGTTGGGTGGASIAETFLADCPSSPAGRDLGWIERNCRRIASDIDIYFNPKEITISKPAP